MMKAFDDIEILFKPEIYVIAMYLRTQNYVEEHPLAQNIDISCTDDLIEYTWHTIDGSHSYLDVMIFRDGRIWFLYNESGRIGSGKHSKFQIYSTEEDLFMLSTVQDDLGIGIKQIKVCNRIWELYF